MLCVILWNLLWSFVECKLVSVNLTVDVLFFNTPDTPIKFFTRAYNPRDGQPISGPTIRVTQGDNLKIVLKNNLLQDFNGPPNSFRLANHTNLHLHGLHVSPGADDIFRMVEPNSTGVFEYQIPEDHSPGTFWYHPHVHGSSSLQQGGGLAGALIVEPSDPNVLPPELAAMEEEVLLFQHLCFHNLGKYSSSAPYINHLNVVKYGKDDIDPRPEYMNASAVPDYFLVNGRYQPTITMKPGQFKLFRMVGAGTSAFLELQVVGSSQACDMYVVAKDGIFVDKAYSEPSLLLVPGSRLDVAVMCSKEGGYVLRSKPIDPFTSQLAHSTIVFEGVLAKLAVVGQPVVMAPPSKLPARPPYLPDLTKASVPQENKFSLAFETQGANFVPGPPFPVMHINGVSFSTKDTFVTTLILGEVYEWQVGIAQDSNVGAGNHPFHVHVNPYQVVGIANGLSSLLGIKVGEYRDTIPMWQSGLYTIRFVPDSFTGRALIHCHMIPHIDLGMAAVANITNSTLPHQLSH